MSEILLSLRRRLDKIDEQIARRKLCDELANCNCQNPRIIVHFSKNEEREIVSCPAHDVSRLERVIHVHFVSPDRDLAEKQLNDVDQFSET